MLEKVQLYSDDTHYYVDIYMLVETIDNQEILKKIKEQNDSYLNSLLPKSKQKVTFAAKSTKKGVDQSKLHLKFDDIKDCINGFGRIIHYKSNNSNPDPQFNELEKVEEGQFLKGMKHGYCRSISAINGQCAAGYHKSGVASGKWCCYNANGDFSHA